MNIATVILVYVVSWWICFFMALPIGVRAQNETGDEVQKGTMPSAPSNPNLKKKALVTSLIALLITVGYYYLATSDLISFRGLTPS
jgi:predicted secreted protein